MYNVGFLQNPNQQRGIISNDQVGGFRYIIIYNKFYLFISINGEYVSMNQCFQYFFIWFIIVVHLVTVKKFDICLLTGWSSRVFILWVNISNHTFNLFINNIVWKLIIDESLFYVFYLFIKYCFGGDQFGTGYQIINNCFFYIWRGIHFSSWGYRSYY